MIFRKISICTACEFHIGFIFPKIIHKIFGARIVFDEDFSARIIAIAGVLKTLDDFHAGKYIGSGNRKDPAGRLWRD